MSGKGYKRLALAGINVNDSDDKALKEQMASILENGIHGISFSPYLPGQKPGDIISAKQISARMSLIDETVGWVRVFSCSDGNEQIPVIAKSKGLKTMVGAWLNDDMDSNEKEVEKLIELAQQGYVDIAAVGNEVLLRGDLTEEQLLGYINRVKEALPDIDVGYVDAYYEFEVHPRISDACDVILANCYPFWEGCALEYSILYMKDMYKRAQAAAKGKKVIIAETGWPCEGPSEWGAVPSYSNAMKYFVGTYQWAEEDDVEIFYFSSFDEAWKVDAEGGVGAHWGLWDAQGEFKY